MPPLLRSVAILRTNGRALEFRSTMTFPSSCLCQRSTIDFDGKKSTKKELQFTDLTKYNFAIEREIQFQFITMI